MTDKTEINRQKMKILLGIRGFSIVPLNETQALWRINSENSATIDVTFPAELWEVKRKNQTSNNWKTDATVPAGTKCMLEALEEDFEAACYERAANGWPEEKEEALPEKLEGTQEEVPEELAKLENIDTKLIKMLGNLLTGIADPSFKGKKAEVM